MQFPQYEGLHLHTYIPTHIQTSWRPKDTDADTDTDMQVTYADLHISGHMLFVSVTLEN